MSYSNIKLYKNICNGTTDKLSAYAMCESYFGCGNLSYGNEINDCPFRQYHNDTCPVSEIRIFPEHYFKSI